MFFSKGIYYQGIKKIRTCGIGFAAIVIGMNLLYAFSEGELFASESPLASKAITGGAIAPFTVLMLVFSYGMVMSMFSFLNKRGGSDFLHSVPHKRICVYISLTSALFTWIVGTVFLTVLMNSIIFHVSVYYTISISQAFLTFLGYSASALVVAGVTAVCRMVSGTLFSCFIYTVCLFPLPRLLAFVLKGFILELNPSITIEKTFLKVFMADYSLYFPFKEIMNREAGSFGDVGLLLFLLSEAFLLFIVAAFLYVRRKSETAGDTTPSKGMLFLFKAVSLTIILCFAISSLILTHNAFLFFILAIVSILAYFLLDLAHSKSISKAVKALPLFLIPLLASVLIMASLYGIAEVFRSTNPKIHEIEYVEILETNSAIFPKEYCNIKSKSELVKEIAVDALNETNNKTIRKNILNVKFTMKDGEEKYRTIYLHNTNALQRIIGELVKESE